MVGCASTWGTVEPQCRGCQLWPFVDRCLGEQVFTSKKVVLSVERGPTGALYFSDESTIYRLVVG
jgi:hypothetical protein